MAQVVISAHMRETATANSMSARQWRAFAILWFAMFVIAVGFGMVVPILPVFARDLGASGLWLGLAFSGFAVTQTPLTPVMGRLGDRWGRRPFIMTGLGIYVFVGIGLALADTFQAVAALRMVMGVGGACMFTSALATIGELAPRGREGRYMGLFMVSFTSGFGIGPLIGGILKDSVGVDAAFLTLAGAAVFALLLVAALMPSQSAIRRTDEELAAIAPVRDMFRDFRVLALFAFNFTFGLGIGAVMTFIAIFMNDVLLASATMVGLVVGSRAVLSSVFQPIFGRLADRVPRQHMVAIERRSSGGGNRCYSPVPHRDGAVGRLSVAWSRGERRDAGLHGHHHRLGQSLRIRDSYGSHKRHTGLWPSGRLLGEQRC